VTRLDRRAVGMLAGTVVLVAVMLPLAAGREEVFDTVLYSTLTLVLGVVGTLIASRHPGNLIGWMFCGMALWGAVAELGEAYGYVAAERGLPGGVAGEWLISWSWVVDVTAWVLVVLLFPDGRLPGRRWRPVIWVSLAGAVLVFVGQALDANLTEGFTGGRNPLGVDSPPVEAAWPVGLVLLVGGLVAAVVSSVLRYRLYDIDVLINRTLVYAVLTAALAGAYQLSVLVLQVALGPLIADSDLAVAGSTLAVAALFRPARARIQAAVDHRFYRRSYDAARTLERLAARLRNEVDLGALQAEVCAAVSDTLQPTHVSLWLRGDPSRGPVVGRPG
jgi:hypothetical protein